MGVDMSDEEKEAERRQVARVELASRLYAALGFALAADLQSESALIAKLIEATLTGTATQLYMKIK